MASAVKNRIEKLEAVAMLRPKPRIDLSRLTDEQLELMLQTIGEAGIGIKPPRDA
jgi:hypothetical protein